MLKVFNLSNDLFISAIVTIAAYYVILYLFYLLLSSSSNELHDPSQPLNNNYNNQQICAHANTNDSSTAINKNMRFLADLTSKILDKTHEKYFLCYRTLFKLFKYNSPNFAENLDICIYDSRFSSLSLVENLSNQFGYSSIEIELNAIRNKYKNFNYRYNRFLGYYELNYLEATVYIYVFVYSPSNKLEFETIRRNGLFYTQFDYLTEMLKIERFKLNKHSVTLWNKLPIYMVDDMFYKIKLFNSYFYLPVDPHEMLMYNYPSLWWQSNVDCLF